MHMKVLPPPARMFTLRILGLILALVLAAGLASASHAKAAETKTFTGLKACSGLITPTTQTCLVTASSLEILMGATMQYTYIVFYADYLTSPILLTAIDEEESTATGRCTFYFAGHGLCEFWSGTGKLAGFHATIVVGTTTSPSVYSLAGTYWFDRHHADDDNDRD